MSGQHMGSSRPRLGLVAAFSLLIGAGSMPSGAEAATAGEPARVAPTEPTEPTAGDGPCSTLAEPVTLTVSNNTVGTVFAPFYVALHTGAFEAAGLDVRVENTSSSDAVPLLGRGTLDIVAGQITAGMLNAIGSGFENRWVAPGFQQNPQSLAGLWVRNDWLGERSVEDFDIAELEGETIASPTGLGGATSFAIGRLLLDVGLTLNDVEFVRLDGNEVGIALENGQIDIGYISDPQWTEFVDSDVVTHLLSPDNGASTGYVFGPSMKGKRDAGVAFLRVLQDTIEHFGMDETDWLDDPDTSAVVAEALDLPPEVLDAGVEPVFDPSLQLDPQLASDIQTIFMASELLDFDEPLPIEAVIDQGYASDASACP